VKTTMSARCARRTHRQEPITTWARSVVAQPARHHATEREADIIAALLAELVIR
jgi:hypothetical protein